MTEPTAAPPRVRRDPTKSTYYFVFVWLVLAVATAASIALDGPPIAVALAAWSGGILTGSLIRLARHRGKIAPD